MTFALPVQVAQVQRGEIREFVDELGKTRLPDVYVLTMPFPGRIQEITLREGEKVRVGQVVAQVSVEDLANEVAEAKAAVERLDASLAENDDVRVEIGAKRQSEKYVESMDATVAAAEARKVAGQKKLDFAETYLGRIKRLFNTGANNQDDLDRADVQFVQSQIDFRQDVLVAEALKALQAATTLMPQMVTDYISKKSLTHNVLDKQKSEAQVRLKQALLRQERGSLKSPVDGVLLERPIRDEQFLSAGTVLVKIGRLADLEMEADILSQDVVNIQPGASAEIYGPAVGRVVNEGVPAVIDRIYPAGFTKVSSLGVEQQRVKVIVRFAESELEKLQASRQLGVDYRVRVRIYTAKKTETLVVPRSALFRGPDGGWHLFADRGGRARLQPIEVGLINDEAAEIRSGVQQGEEVILAPEHSLRDGARVKAISR
jgi:HlyD family secretion protein